MRSLFFTKLIVALFLSSRHFAFIIEEIHRSRATHCADLQIYRGYRPIYKSTEGYSPHRETFFDTSIIHGPLNLTKLWQNITINENGYPFEEVEKHFQC